MAPIIACAQSGNAPRSNSPVSQDLNLLGSKSSTAIRICAITITIKSAGVPFNLVIIFEALLAFVADFAAAVGGLAGGCAAAAFVAGVAGFGPAGGTPLGVALGGSGVTAGVLEGTAGLALTGLGAAVSAFTGAFVAALAATFLTAFEAAFRPACVAREIASKAKGLFIFKSSGSWSNSSSSSNCSAGSGNNSGAAKYKPTPAAPTASISFFPAAIFYSILEVLLFEFR